MENLLKTCKRGHPITEDSAYRTPEGWISQCKACQGEARALPENRAKRASHERGVRATPHGRA